MAACRLRVSALQSFAVRHSQPVNDWGAIGLSETAAIVLAAGKSTRMKGDLPKVLHEVCGKPMLAYVLSACRLAGVDRLLVVVGYGKEKVQKRFEGEKNLEWIEQAAQKGTGHAVGCCRKALEGFDGSVLVIAGDMPLVQREPLAKLLEVRERTGDAVTIATTMLEAADGYGRITRDDEGKIEAIVEHDDCSSEQLKIREVNPSYYCFDSKRLFPALEKLKPERSKGELYLTDLIKVFRKTGQGASAVVDVPAEDAMGVNSRLDLAQVGRVVQDRIQLGAMSDGVTIVDPDNTWIESDATIGKDTVVYPFSMIRTGAIIGNDCRIGPFACVSAGETVPDGTVVGAVAGGGLATS